MLAEIVFLVLALVILLASIKMLLAKEVLHSAVWLALVLAGVAGIYLTIGAQFLAAIQVLIYVGAVVTLILFTIMLTTPSAETEGYAEDKTPLAVMGIPAPPGVDIESMQDAPASATTVREAEGPRRRSDEEVA